MKINEFQPQFKPIIQIERDTSFKSLFFSIGRVYRLTINCSNGSYSLKAHDRKHHFWSIKNKSLKITDLEVEINKSLFSSLVSESLSKTENLEKLIALFEFDREKLEKIGKKPEVEKIDEGIRQLKLQAEVSIRILRQFLSIFKFDKPSNIGEDFSKDYAQYHKTRLEMANKKKTEIVDDLEYNVKKNHNTSKEDILNKDILNLKNKIQSFIPLLPNKEIIEIKERIQSNDEEASETLKSIESIYEWNQKYLLLKDEEQNIIKKIKTFIEWNFQKTQDKLENKTTIIDNYFKEINEQNLSFLKDVVDQIQQKNSFVYVDKFNNKTNPLTPEDFVYFEAKLQIKLNEIIQKSENRIEEIQKELAKQNEIACEKALSSYDNFQEHSKNLKLKKKNDLEAIKQEKYLLLELNSSQIKNQYITPLEEEKSLSNEAIKSIGFNPQNPALQAENLRLKQKIVEIEARLKYLNKVVSFHEKLEEQKETLNCSIINQEKATERVNSCMKIVLSEEEIENFNEKNLIKKIGNKKQIFNESNQKILTKKSKNELNEIANCQMKIFISALEENKNKTEQKLKTKLTKDTYNKILEDRKIIKEEKEFESQESFKKKIQNIQTGLNQLCERYTENKSKIIKMEYEKNTHEIKKEFDEENSLLTEDNYKKIEKIEQKQIQEFELSNKSKKIIASIRDSMQNSDLKKYINNLEEVKKINQEIENLPKDPRPAFINETQAFFKEKPDTDQLDAIRENILQYQAKLRVTLAEIKAILSERL